MRKNKKKNKNKKEVTVLYSDTIPVDFNNLRKIIATDVVKILHSTGIEKWASKQTEDLILAKHSNPRHGWGVVFNRDFALYEEIPNASYLGDEFKIDEDTKHEDAEYTACIDENHIIDGRKKRSWGSMVSSLPSYDDLNRYGIEFNINVKNKGIALSNLHIDAETLRMSTSRRIKRGEIAGFSYFNVLSQLKITTPSFFYSDGSEIPSHLYRINYPSMCVPLEQIEKLPNHSRYKSLKRINYHVPRDVLIEKMANRSSDDVILNDKVTLSKLVIPEEYRNKQAMFLWCRPCNAPKFWSLHQGGGKAGVNVDDIKRLFLKFTSESPEAIIDQKDIIILLTHLAPKVLSGEISITQYPCSSDKLLELEDRYMTDSVVQDVITRSHRLMTYGVITVDIDQMFLSKIREFLDMRGEEENIQISAVKADVHKPTYIRITISGNSSIMEHKFREARINITTRRPKEDQTVIDVKEDLLRRSLFPDVTKEESSTLTCS